MLTPKCPGVLCALAHIPAALQHDRPEPHLRQNRGGKQATGAKPNNQRALFKVSRRDCNRVIVSVGGLSYVHIIRKARQNSRLIPDLEMDDIHKGNLGILLASVIAALENAEADQFIIGQLQPLENGLTQRGFRMIERKRKFTETDHGKGFRPVYPAKGH